MIFYNHSTVVMYHFCLKRIQDPAETLQ